MDQEFEMVARLSDLPEKRSKIVQVADDEVVLWNSGGVIYAIKNSCPHQHHAVLHEAALENGKITCPMHGWCFSLETGEAVKGNGKLKQLEVKIANGDILVKHPPSFW